MKVLSLFDGISATNQALKNLGIKYHYYASEIDPYAIKITQKNFPNTIQLGDVKELEVVIEPFNWAGTIKGEYLLHTGALISSGCDRKNMLHIEGGIDLLSFGFPCQDLSIAKKDRKGLDGERSGLFFEALRILNEVKPKYFLAENVASMSKEMKDLITSHLYGIEPVLLNSALVSAQQRKRLFWIGGLQEDGTYAKVDIPQPEDRGILLKDILESGESFVEKSYCIDANYHKGSNLKGTLEKHRRTLVVEPICVASRGRNIVNGKRQDIKGAKTQQRLEPNLNGKTNTLTTVAKDNLVLQPVRIGHYNKGGQGDRIYSVQGKSVCLSANGGGRGALTGLYKIDLPHGEYHIRKLTPNECARLQGFPDNYHDGISNTQAYKCYGNSFTVPVIEHILKAIFI